MRWSEAVTLEFVNIYLKHECLWNPSNAGYKQKHVRDTAYIDICNEFKSSTMKNLTILEIKNKIKNLRTTYVQQVQKILQKSSPDSLYEPSLIWFNEMDSCLKNVPTNRHSASFNSSQELPEVDSSCQIWEDQALQNLHEDEINPDPLVPQFSLVDNNYDSSHPDEKERLDIFPYNKIKRKKNKSKISICKNLTDSVITEDEFDVYGKYIASQLRKMDLQKALRLQLHIHRIVSEARISDM